MLDWGSLILFVGTAVVLILIPGPDLIFTVTTGMTYGRRAGVVTALGLSLGNIVHTLAAALGLSLIITTSEVIFTLFKLCGAAYLFFLAVQSISHRKDFLDWTQGEITSSKQLFGRALLMNMLNPKVAIFFLTFLPQFVNYRQGVVWLQMCFLGGIFIVLTAFIFGLFGYFAGQLRERFLTKPGVQKLMHMVAAIIYVFLGILLLFTKV